MHGNVSFVFESTRKLDRSFILKRQLNMSCIFFPRHWFPQRVLITWTFCSAMSQSGQLGLSVMVCLTISFLYNVYLSLVGTVVSTALDSTTFELKGPPTKCLLLYVHQLKRLLFKFLLHCYCQGLFLAI